MPQSYDFIFISARDFWEKLRKKVRDCVFYVTGQGSICHDDRWRIDPSYFPVSLISPQPAKTYRLGEFHEML